jgi:hypothetical protein
MSAEIFQFSTAPRRLEKIKTSTRVGEDIGDNLPAEVTAFTPSQRRRQGKPELPPPVTETAKNARIRVERREAWRCARNVAEYWSSRADWHSALSYAQQHGIGDSGSFPALGYEGRGDLVDKWRAAVTKQLLTPAPDLAAVTWKRAKLKSDEFEQLPIKAPRVEQAIADDVAFLEAHPTRRSINASRQAAQRKEEQQDD